MQEENKKRVKLLERASNQVNKEDNEQEGFDWEDDEEHSKGKLHDLLSLSFPHKRQIFTPSTIQASFLNSKHPKTILFLRFEKLKNKIPFAH